MNNKINSKLEKFLNALSNKNNDKATKIIERVMQEKVAKRIRKILNANDSSK